MRGDEESGSSLGFVSGAEDGGVVWMVSMLLMINHADRELSCEVQFMVKIWFLRHVLVDEDSDGQVIVDLKVFSQKCL